MSLQNLIFNSLLGNSPLYDYDNNFYNTVTIGSQQWIVENLRTTHFADGAIIPQITIANDNMDAWDNSSGVLDNRFEVFTNNGLSIIDASGSSSHPRTCESTISELQKINLGCSIDISLSNFVLYSGTAPNIELFDEGTPGGLVHFSAVSNKNIHINIDNSIIDIFLLHIKNSDINDNPFDTHFSVDVCVNITHWAVDSCGGCCYYDNNEESYKNEYGALYNWHAIDNSHGLVYFKRNNIQETGWRVPTQTDISTLYDYLGSDEFVGGKLKEVGGSYWNDPNVGATDEYGFDARGAGVRDWTGVFSSNLTDTQFWSSTPSDANNAYNFGLTASSSEFTIGTNIKRSGASIRCVRNI